MKYTIKTRNSQGRKVYVKIDEAKTKASGSLVYAGFTRDKHGAHHYDTLGQAKEALKEFKVAYDHMSFSIEEHLPHVINEGMRTEPADSVAIAILRALKLFPDVDFEHLKWSDGVYAKMDAFDLLEVSKGLRGTTSFTITVPQGTGEVHILDDNNKAIYWATFM